MTKPDMTHQPAVLASPDGIGIGSATETAALVDRIRALERRIESAEEAFARLQDEVSVLEMIVEHARDGIVVQDILGRIEWSNPSYSRITGWAEHEIMGRRPQEFILPPEDMPPAEVIENFSYDRGFEHFEQFELVRNIRKDGTIFWNQLSFSLVDFGKKGAEKVIVVSRDVTEQIEHQLALRDAREDILYRAEHDLLTGLANRCKLESFLTAVLRDGALAGRQVGVLTVDLDRFKGVNDTHGHAAGDAVLKNAAERMAALVRNGDLVARTGGDEFVIVCPGINSFSVPLKIGRRLVEALAQPVEWEGKELQIGASVGIALSDNERNTPGKLIQAADVALYQVKQAGRNGVACFTDALGERFSQRKRTAQELKAGLDGDQFDVFLQPQFCLQRRVVTGFETLLRWHHPQRGTLAPAAFLDVADENNLMVEIDKIAVRKGLAALNRLRRQGFADARVSLNVSAPTLSQRGYVDLLKWEADSQDIPTEAIAIEVLETVLLDGSEGATIANLKALKAAGFLLELDDFGTGYAGLTHLAQLDIDRIKLDRSLVARIVDEQAARTIVRGIAALCRELNVAVISEGVETRAQADLLLRLGCPEVQGYGICRPMLMDRLEQWLASTNFDTVLQPGASTLAG